jgi:hypothetical protein
LGDGDGLGPSTPLVRILHHFAVSVPHGYNG